MIAFTNYDWLIFFAVPVITWIIGMGARSSGTWRGYFLAKSSLPTSSVVATYFGANLTFTAIFLVLSEEAYSRGYWVFCIPASWILGTFFFKWLYKYTRPYIEQGMTLHQAIGAAFNSTNLQKLTSIWTILAFVGTVALEFYGGVKLLQWIGIPLLNNLTISLFLALIVSSFTVLGGFRSVAKADIFLDIVSFAAVGIICVFLFSKFSPDTILSLQPADVIENITTNHTSVTPITNWVENLFFVIGAFFIFVPFQICTLDSWQRLSAWQKTGNDLNKVLVFPSMLLALIYCIPILVGIVVRNQGLVISHDSHPLKEFLQFVEIPPYLIGIVIAGFFSAILSTADELLNCASLSLIFDFFQIPIEAERTPDQEKRIVLGGQIYTSVFAFAAAVLALFALWYERQISDLSSVVFSTQVVFTFPLLIALIWKPGAPDYKNIAFTGMVFSFGTAILFVITAWSTGDKIFSNLAPVAAFIISGFLILIAVISKWIIGKAHS